MGGGGGLPDLLQYYIGGVFRDPQIVLRNIHITAPNCHDPVIYDKNYPDCDLKWEKAGKKENDNGAHHQYNLPGKYESLLNNNRITKITKSLICWNYVGISTIHYLKNKLAKFQGYASLKLRLTDSQGQSEEQLAQLKIQQKWLKNLLPRVTATASPSLSLAPGVILLPCSVTLTMMMMMTMRMMRRRRKGRRRKMRWGLQDLLVDT